MGTLYCDTTGSATNSGSNDGAALLTGTAAAWSGSTTITLLVDNPDLSGLITSGATQSSIYLVNATNTNKKIFWITAFDNTAGVKTITVDTIPTGTTGSVWTIGGRFVLTNASQEGALRAGDTMVINNNTAGQAASSWTFRIAGDSTSGYAKIVGKSGTRPVLTTSGSGNGTVNFNTLGGTWVENLELKQTHASSGSATTGYSSGGNTLYNVKISAAPGNGATITNGTARIIASEITGCGADGLNVAANTIVFGCYIHDNTGDGIEYTAIPGTFNAINNVIDTNAGRGIFLSGGPSPANAGIVNIIGNTVYANGNSGLEITDADMPVFLVNNIFVNNGDAANEYNVEWAAGTAEATGFHSWNDFFSSGGGGSANLLNLTVNATEITTDPSMTDPANGDFSISSASGAKATGFPGQHLGTTSIGYMDMGATQITTTLQPFMGSAQ